MSRGGDDSTLPDLTGLSARDAVRRLARLGCTTRLSGEGFVVGQEPAPGSPLPREGGVTLSLAMTPPVQRAALGDEGAR